MVASRLVLAVALALCAAGAAATGQGFFPCHQAKSRKSQSTCSRVAMPAGLCSSCALNPVETNGQFKECDGIYDFAEPRCLSKIGEYVAMNECHADLADAYGRYQADTSDWVAAQDMDYFLYSLCEQCCDCVPMGVDEDAYDSLSAEGKLMHHTRGNCPAHAVYDVCRLHPYVEEFAEGGEGVAAPDAVAGSGRRGPVCNGLYRWLNSPDSADWQQQPETKLATDLASFLDKLTTSAGCTEKNVWDRCWVMENAQKHLGDVEAAEMAPFEEEEEEEEKEEKEEKEEEGDGGEESAKSDQAVDSSESSSGTLGDTDSVSATDTPSDTNRDSASGEAPPASASSSPTKPETQAEDTNSTSEAGGISECFPGTATVELDTGAVVPIRALQIGDSVRVSASQFSSVYLFSHRAPSVGATEYVRIEVASNATTALVLTEGHYLRINGRDIPTPAKDVVPGDAVLSTSSGWVPVTRTSRVVQDGGLYNPHTLHGEIVVNGIVTSTYTTAVAPSIASVLLAPVRAAYKLGIINEKTAGHLLTNGWAGVSANTEL